MITMVTMNTIRCNTIISLIMGIERYIESYEMCILLARPDAKYPDATTERSKINTHFINISLCI